ncbi:hypothetical protein EWB00_003238 [Schistosoma japonicum]|uniref:Uncharacterized protein n=1 Tax=Schistosoma japonicum TaxID=6182 RepID=A0A4Z2D9G4_SCHJA|nr:Terminal uridylyltransferase 7 [Schistosoma japonicum]TNN13038.1 hypothetical protein EWB00_003238 [Schistosoma japonicum]
MLFSGEQQTNAPFIENNSDSGIVMAGWGGPETLTESLHVSDESDPSRNTTTISNDKTTTAKVLHLTPMIDDSDNFSSNLDKVC